MIIWQLCFFLASIWLYTLFSLGPYTSGVDLGKLFFGLFIEFLIVLVGFADIILLNLQKIDKAIEIEWSFIDAVSRDFQEAYRSVEQIEGRANQVWELEALKLRELTLRLSEGEKRWAKETGDLSSDTRKCIKEWRSLLKFTKLMTCSWLNIQRSSKSLLKEVDLAFAMRRAKMVISEYRKPRGRECAINSVALLEEYRRRVRTLRDRPLDDANIDPPKQPIPSEVLSVLKRLVHENPNMTGSAKRHIQSVVIQLKFLRALMKDLKGVRLESHIEAVWLQGAQEIVDRAHKVITAFLQEASNQIRWLSRVSDFWRYGPKLKEVMMNINNLLACHFEAKKRYGLNFTVRGLSKSAILDLHHRIDDDASGAVMSILTNLRLKLLKLELEGIETTERKISVYYLFRKLHSLENKLLMNKEATMTRKACYSILKRLLSDLYRCVDKLQWVEIDHITHDVMLLECFPEIKVADESCSTVGLKEDIRKLVLKLTDERSVGHPLIIAIVGMRGVGKKTLAKEIRNHQSIVKAFPSRPWVTVQNINDPIDLLQSVVTQIMEAQETSSTRDYSFSDLSSFLKEHKTLVFLDGLFSTSAWDSLRPVLIPEGSVSAVVLITRDKEVAFHAKASYVHRHRLRTAEESWEFFTQMVNIPREKEVVKLAKKVVERTGGLPLAILRLGYLLFGKSIKKEELLSSHERISQGQSQSPWEDNLEQNMRDFQSQPAIETCLSYFQFFPKDFEVPVRRLVAVGFAPAIPSTQTIGSANALDPAKKEEHVAYGYLLDLIDRNMVQPIEKKHNGKVLTCRFPSVLKEIWLKGRRQKGTAGSWSLCASSERKAFYRFDNNDIGIDGLHSNVLWEDNRPLSITFLDSRKGSGPGQDIHKFIVRAMRSGNFRSLLVLDLESVFKPKLPKNIGKLKQLKYLGLRWTYLEKLPDSVGQLSKLETLDLRRTSLQSLPRSIWKLNTLQRLHLDNNFRIKDMPENPAEISMTDLRKLSGGFVNSQGMALLRSLYKLSNLQKLRLSFQLTLEEQEMLSKNILRLTRLQSLSLRSVNVSNESRDLKLTNLASLQNLSKLYMFGKIDNMCILPRSLTELTLSASEFPRSHLLLETLATLSELKYLSFLSGSLFDRQLVFVRDGFPKLLVLKLWALSDLTSLKVEEGALPKIIEFEIRGCEKLTVTNQEYSTGLTRLRTLQELKFTDMSREYVVFVEKEFAKAKRQNFEGSVHFPIIKIKNYDHEASNM